MDKQASAATATRLVMRASMAVRRMDGAVDDDSACGDVEAGDGDDNSCDEKQTMEVDDDD